MYQAHLFRSEKKLLQKPILSFSLYFDHKLNLKMTNIGNGLARNIRILIKTQDGDLVKQELRIKSNGLSKGDCLIINNWEKGRRIGNILGSTTVELVVRRQMRWQRYKLTVRINGKL